MSQTEDRDFVDSLLQKKVEVAALIPDKTDLAGLGRIVKLCGKSNVNVERHGRKFKYILAQSMIYAQRNPSLWSAKYDSFDEFSKSTLYQPDFEEANAKKYKSILEKWQHVQFQELAEIPTKSMWLISKVTNESEPSGKNYLEAARKMPYEQLVAYVAKKSGKSRDELTNASFPVKGTVEEIRDLQRDLKNPKIHEVVGSDSAAVIFRAALDELCSTHGIELEKQAEVHA